MAERLNFMSNPTPYNSMLAAEHIVRYDAVLKFCQGKRVLDIASGEGYGAAYLADRGASSVLAVDISGDAIASAKRNFARPNINFVCADATDIDRWNPTGEKFDVIACFETIEHVPSAKVLISILRNMAANDGVILISCPNDTIENERGIKNPYHTGVFSFDAFKEMTTEILGEASQWLWGCPLTGISLHDVNSSISGSDDECIRQMLNIKPSERSLILPAQPSHRVDENGTTFYMGIWNGILENSFVAAPISRKSYLENYFNIIELKENAKKILFKNENLLRTVEIIERRIATINRISYFYLEKTNEMNAKISGENHYLRNEVNNKDAIINGLQASLNLYSSSRAHRLAALYIRSSIGRPPFLKFFYFILAVGKSGIRAIRRRMPR